MKKMKVCFVGIGSIARRHIKNLRKICSERDIELVVDALRRTDKVENDLDLDDVFLYEEELPMDYDIIFITNPTDYHLDVLKKINYNAKNFFIEKPLTSINKLKDVEEIVCREGVTYYIACPLRYTSVIQYLKKNIEVKDVLGVRCISSSYLPDWRPGIDYRETYSADKDLGGGVSIDLIHEWDYIKYLFGMPSKVHYVSGKVSNLELKCEDYATYIAEYSDKVVELHLDYFGRKTIREIMLFTEEDTIIGDLINSRVTYLKSGKVVEFGEERDDFQISELKYFLDMIEEKAENNNNVEDAYQTLKLTQGEI